MLRERRRNTKFKPNPKLDRKSSRGMIFENEELRIRTININAEVERGQSDIKKLRRENAQLKKEIWTLRDEYDRLGKLLTTKNRPIRDYDGTVTTTDCHYDDGCDYDDEGMDHCSCGCLSNEDNISCDIRNHNDTYSKNDSQLNGTSISNGERKHTNVMPTTKSSYMDKVNIDFDHLSVVSEECLSNSDDPTNSCSVDATDSSSKNADDALISSFQSTVPPLTHFENLCYKDIGPNLDSLDETQDEATPPPPTPPLQTASNRQSDGSLPFPPPPISSKEASPESSPEISIAKLIRFPLKSKSKNSPDTTNEQHPDLCVNNGVPVETNRIATIRKPHTPLKCPSISKNVGLVAIDDLLAINDYTADSSSGTDAPPAQTDRVHKNDAIKGPDHPYRTEMSLVLSYDGQKSKYTTSSDLEKAQEIGTPPPNVPQAMKLLPNKLPYASTTASKSDIEINAIDSPRNDANNENDTNEKLLTKSQVKLIVTDECKASLEKGCGSQEVNNDDDYSVAGTSNENNKSVEQFDMNERIDVIDEEEEEEEDLDKQFRRISIQCNGEPLTDQEQEMPATINFDRNIMGFGLDEAMLLTPTTYRYGRRTSCLRKPFDVDTFGAFLYPPSPHFSYKRGRRSSVSRRHSDSLLPALHDPYYIDNAMVKNSRHACQKNQTRRQNHHLVDASGKPYASSNGLTVGESLATTICNSLASSRESISCASQRSTTQQNKRKLSATSESRTSGKIPWCACWGSGCI